jgi:hypothetical protein
MIRLFLLMTLTAALAIGAEGDKKPANSDGDTVQTPFGPAKKNTAAPQPPPPPSTAKPLVDVKLDGDTYTFSRQTPFGSQSWKRAKSELSSDEKKLVDAHEAWEKKQAEKAKPEPADKPQS